MTLSAERGYEPPPSVERGYETTQVTFVRSRGRELWQRFWRSRRAVVGAVVLTSVVAIALLAPLIAPYPFDTLNLYFARKPPMSVDPNGNLYILGTDALGRDMLSRILWGARVSLLVGVVSVLLASSIGIPIGLITGYYGGRLDAVIMRLADIQLAIPGLILAIALIAVLGGSLFTVIFVLGFTAWVGYARIVRGQVLSLKEQPFVEAARASGGSDWRIIAKHILPNVWTPVIVIATSHVGGVIIAESSLTFLGVGISPSIPTWGILIADGRNYLDTAPWIATYPGVALTITVLAVFFFGDGLRDVLDPRLRL
jgi:peptide/nickel transport system permease protein